MQVTLDASSVSSIVQLLMVLSETPSTPSPIAEQAESVLIRLQDEIPPQPHHWEPGSRVQHGTVELDAALAAATGGLLDLLSGMPSTPPSIAEEAARHAATLWKRAGDQQDG